MRANPGINRLLEPNPRAVLGGNLPPLDETLPVETEDLRKRAEELIASAAERAMVTTDDEAERATALFAMMREHWRELDEARTKRKAPFAEAAKQVDEHFGAITFPLVGAEPRRKITGAAGELLARVDAYRQEKERQAEAERQRLEEAAAAARREAAEAERQRQVAEQAQQAAEDKASASEAELTRRVAEQAQQAAEDKASAAEAARQKSEAELTRRVAADRAAHLEAQAAEPAPVVIRSGYGPKASGRVDRTARIVNLTLAIRHCLKIDRHKIEATVLQIFNAQLRAGVKDLPGAEIVSSSKTIIRG